MDHFEKEWENEEVSKCQLELNKKELDNNYPPHWIHLLKCLESIPNVNDVTFHDIPCGVGSTYKLLQKNDVNCLYKGYDMSKYMVEIAKKEWKYEHFYICTIENLTIDGHNDLIYVDGLLDILSNSPDIFNHILSLKSKYVIVNRIHFSEKTEISTYVAYNLINVVDYKYRYEDFINIINEKNYRIQNQIHNLFLLELI